MRQNELVVTTIGVDMVDFDSLEPFCRNRKYLLKNYFFRSRRVLRNELVVKAISVDDAENGPSEVCGSPKR